jgi:ribosomal protein L37E
MNNFKRNKLVAMCGRCGYRDQDPDAPECDNCGYVHMIKMPAKTARKIRNDQAVDAAIKVYKEVRK